MLRSQWKERVGPLLTLVCSVLRSQWKEIIGPLITLVCSVLKSQWKERVGPHDNISLFCANVAVEGKSWLDHAPQATGFNTTFTLHQSSTKSCQSSCGLPAVTLLVFLLCNAVTLLVFLLCNAVTLSVFLLPYCCHTVSLPVAFLLSHCWSSCCLTAVTLSSFLLPYFCHTVSLSVALLLYSPDVILCG